MELVGLLLTEFYLDYKHFIVTEVSAGNIARLCNDSLIVACLYFLDFKGIWEILQLVKNGEGLLQY